VPKVNRFNELHLETAHSRIHGAEYSLLNADKTQDFLGRDIVCFGIPFSTGDHANLGTNKAPNAVRESSIYYASDMYPYPSHYDLRRVADGGNLYPSLPTDTARNCLLDLRNQVREKLSQDDFRPVFIGGDHTLPYATLAALSEHLQESLAVLHFDAHPDSGNFEEINQGTFMYDLSTSGHIDAEHSFQFFIRNDVHTEGEYRHITDKFRIFDTFAMHGALRQDGFDNLVKEVKQVIGSRPVWISFDVDAFDAAYAPATTIPMHNGATSEEVATLFLKLSTAGLNVVGGEVVELIPDLDVPTKTTCGLAARVMRDIAYLTHLALPKRH